MEHITLLSCVLAGIGLLTNIYAKYKNRKNKNRPFSFVFWLQDNFLETIFSIALTFCALLFTDSILFFLQIPDTSQYKVLNVLYFLAGAMHHHVVKAISKWFRKTLP